MKHTSTLMLSMAGILMASHSVAAKLPTIEQALVQCKQDFSADTQARLQCFDQIMVPDVALSAEAPAEVKVKPKAIETAVIKAEPDARHALSFLERKWRLSSTVNWDVSDLEAHKQNYLITSWSNRPNNVANSPTHAATNFRNLDNKDVQFQLSVKTQLIDDLPIVRDFPWVTSSRLWVAYTQKSFWQIYNSAQSRPFRESNYAPEVILSLGLDDKINGQYYALMPRMLNVGFIHESNGKDDPISRSWNRVYLQAAWEFKEAYTILLRPWYRFAERGVNDNPDIASFLGYGDLTIRWDDLENKKAVNLLLRNNLRSDNKGYAKLSFLYEPFKTDNIKLYMSLSSGYGESLLDYNHSQTVFGLGFAVGE